MSKELEALDSIKVSLVYFREYAIDVLPNKAKQFREENDDDFIILESTLKRLEKTNCFLGNDIFTFVKIMNPFHNFYVWNNHNKQIVKLCCYGARRTFDGKEIYVSNMSCSAWLALKEYGNTWSLYKSDLEKKWLNKENEDGRK